MSGIDQALALTVAKFQGVTDKDGKPYILHCLRVMMGVKDPEGQLVALMHDLIEDTDVTLADLATIGFSEAVCTGIELITHPQGMSYADYVVRLKPNALARSAKLSDLRDNYSLDRVAFRDGFEQEDANRIQKYALSFQFLSDRIDEPEYLRRMGLLSRGQA